MVQKVKYVIESVDKYSKDLNNLNSKFSKISYKFDDVSGKSRNLGANIKSIGSSNNLSNTKKLNSTLSTVGDRATLVSKKFNLLKLAVGGFLGFATISTLKNFTSSMVATAVEIDNLNAVLGAAGAKFYKGKSSTEVARLEMKFLKDTANELGVSLQALAMPYAKFVSSSEAGVKTTKATFTSFLKLGRVFALTPFQMEGVITALTQMQSKTVVSAEELRGQLGDRLPGVMKLFADSAKMSVKDFTKLMETGKVSAKMLKLVGEQIETQYVDKIGQATSTLGSRQARLSNSFFLLKTQIAQNLKPAFISVTSALTSFLQKVVDSGKIQDFFNFMKTSKEIDILVKSFKVAGIVIVEVLKMIGNAIKFTFITLTAFAKTSIEGLGIIGQGIIDSVKKVIQFVQQVAESIGNLFGKLFGFSDQAKSELEQLKNISAESTIRVDQVTRGNIKQSFAPMDINVTFDQMPEGAKAKVLQTPTPNNLMTNNNISQNFSPAF